MTDVSVSGGRGISVIWYMKSFVRQCGELDFYSISIA